MMLFEILKKELLSFFRDRKTLLALLLPVLIFPIMFSIAGTQLRAGQESLEQSIPVYCEINSEKSEAQIHQILSAICQIQYVESSAPDEDLKTGRILLAISEIQADNSKQTSKPLRICLTYNMSAAASSSTYSMVKQLLETANIQIAYERLYACGVQDSVFENIVLTEKTVNNNYLLFMMVPMLLAILLTTGGVSIATDSLAGEHDRGTLERIASTSVRMTDILSGKILAIIVVAMISTAITLASYYVSMCIEPEIGEVFGAGSALEKPTFHSILLVLFQSAVYATFIATLLSFVAIVAKSRKAAQSFFAIITLLPSLVSMLILFMSSSKSSYVQMTIPILNYILGLKYAFSGVLTVSQLGVSIVCNLVLAAIFFALSNRLLKSEKYIV